MKKTKNILNKLTPGQIGFLGVTGIPTIILSSLAFYCLIENNLSSRYNLKSNYIQDKNLCSECAEYYANRSISERKTFALERENLNYGKFPKNDELELKCDKIINNSKKEIRKEQFDNFYADASPFLFLASGF